jgi:hypothetical protein
VKERPANRREEAAKSERPTNPETSLYDTLFVLLLAAGCSSGPTIDESASRDVEGEGWSTRDDCDDADPTVNPDAVAIYDDARGTNAGAAYVVLGGL